MINPYSRSLSNIGAEEWFVVVAAAGLFLLLLQDVVDMLMPQQPHVDRSSNSNSSNKCPMFYKQRIDEEREHEKFNWISHDEDHFFRAWTTTRHGKTFC